MTAAEQIDRALDAALAAITPAGVVTGWRRVTDADVPRLLPEEAAAMARAVPARQREFATGRVLLRELLGTAAAIPVGPDRAPVLPAGVGASLAHDHEHAVAAVTKTDGLALGVDLEPTVALDPDVAQLVLRADDGPLDAHLAFTLKEAAYKAWSRSGGGFLDHHDVRLTVGPTAFTATVVDDGVELDGRYARAGDRWVALVVVPLPLVQGRRPSARSAT
jgi:4'-phosphopantetheinyl transferase EntD